MSSEEEKSNHIRVDNSISFPYGTCVRVQNLVAHPELNGKMGEVVTGPNEKGRYQIRVMAEHIDKTFSLAPANFVFCSIW
jgi:hypothetical protein